MTSSPVQVERRAGQRFPYLLSLSLREPTGPVEGVGFTQDVSSRGVFFFTDAALIEGSEIELTLRMPSEITLGDSMPVRCRGRILRVVRPASSPCNSISGQSETKIGVAVRLECYEYLQDSSSASLARVSALHPRHDEEQPISDSSDRP
jgi:hypothetical protein